MTVHEKTPPQSNWLSFSLKSIFVILVGVILFIWYVRVLLYGDNSLRILNRLEDEQMALEKQFRSLKQANQKLQKEYFELIQLITPHDE